MEKFSYNSYPDSTDSSPRSREIDFDNPPPWDDQNHNNHNNHHHPQSYKVKFMCSYNGKIQPRPHDNQLTYVNGETKILSVDRGIRFPVLASKLSAICCSDGGGGGGDVLFKYQLPGEDLDALISVTNDDDLEHMMHEYDRLLRVSSKPARMRLFLFPSGSSGGFGSEGSNQSDRDRFVEALNSTVRSSSSRLEPEKSVTAPANNNNADFLFGSEKVVSSPPPPPPQQPPHEVKLPVPVAAVALEPPLFNDPRVVQPEFQEAVYRRKSEDAGGYFSPTYAAQNPAPPPPAVTQTNQQAPPMTFWQGNHNNNNPGGVFPTTAPGLGLPERPVYMIPTPTPTPHPGSVYHAPPPQTQGVMRPVVTGQLNQGGYYPYNMTQPPVGVAKGQQQQQQQPPPPFTSGPPPPPLQQQYSAVPPPQQVVGIADTRAYTQVTYAGGMGKQVYYTEAPPQYHGIGLPVTGGMSELRTGPDGKLVAMNIMAPPKVSSQNSDSAV